MSAIDMKSEKKNAREGSEAVIEIENDTTHSPDYVQQKDMIDIDMPSPNEYYKDISNISVKLPDVLKNNCSFFIQNISANNEESVVLALIKIIDFKEFLDNKLSFKTDEIDFLLPRYDVKLKGILCITPAEEEYFTVTTTFREDITYEGNNNINLSDDISIVSKSDAGEKKKGKASKKKIEKKLEQKKIENCFGNGEKKGVSYKKGGGLTNTTNNMNGTTSNSNNNINSIDDYKKQFSDKMQKIFEDGEEVSFNMQLGVYNKVKKYFSKTHTEKVKLNQRYIVEKENYLDYQSLIYDHMIDPFILRLKLTAVGQAAAKYEEAAGLVNEANTCYFNVIMQSLFSLIILRRAIYQIPTDDDSPIYEIQKLFHELQNQTGSRASLKCVEIFKKLGWQKSYWNAQQDSQEIFSFIFDILSEAEKNYFDDKAKMSNLCEGSVYTTITCTDIEYESKKAENFLFIQLDLDGCHTLIECIDRFLVIETMVGENMYETPDKTYHEALRSVAFNKIPPILFIQLKRFRYDDSGMIKTNSRMEYPPEIDFANYYGNKITDLVYSLYGVIVHDGNMNSGHYYVFLKDFTIDTWIKYNDTRVTYASDPEVFENNFGGFVEEIGITDDCEITPQLKESSQTAYMLIYVKKDKIDEIFKPITKEDIPESLMQMLTKRGNKTTNVRDKYSISYNQSTLDDYPGLSSKNSSKHILPNSSGRFSGRSYKSNIGSNNSYKPSFEKSNVGAKINTKVKSENYESFNNIGQGIQKRTGNQNPVDSKKSKMIREILNNPVESGPGICIPLEMEKNSKEVANSYIYATSKENKYDKKFKISVYMNSTGTPAGHSTISKQVSGDKKILVMDFLEEIFKNLGPESNTVKLNCCKLVTFSNMGIFLELLSEERNIVPLLEMYHKKKIFLCCYNFDDDFILSINDGLLLAIHPMKKDFSNANQIVDVHNNQGKDINQINMPIFILHEKNSSHNRKEFNELVMTHLMRRFSHLNNQNTCNHIF